MSAQKGEPAKQEFVIPKDAKTDSPTPLRVYAQVQITVWSPIEDENEGTLEADFEQMVVKVRNKLLDWYDGLPTDLRENVQISLRAEGPYS